MSPRNRTKENSNQVSPSQATRTGLGLYLFLLAVQTAGAVIVLVNGVPIYRQMVGDFSKPRPHPGILYWAVGAVALIQGAYWFRVRIQPAMPPGGYIFFGHIAQFAARLSFILASSTFAVVFLARFEQLSLPLHRILMVLALLFSLFCFSLELERLGKALQETEGKP
jgi:hypothetical protein